MAIKATRKAKELQLRRLNQTDRKPVGYKIDQKVAIVMPNRGLSADCRAKHTPAWSGPMTVTRCESKTIYEVREDCSDKLFRRHVSNICPSHGEPGQKKEFDFVEEARSQDHAPQF